MELYTGSINNRVLIDTDDTFQVALTYAFADFLKPLSQKSDFSKTVLLPGTDLNIRELNIQIGSSSYAALDLGVTIKDMIIYEGGRILLKGSLKVLKINYSNSKVLSIEVGLFGDRFTLMQLTGKKTIADSEMRWSDYAGETTFANIKTNALDDTIFYKGVAVTAPYTDADRPYLIQGYRYPMVDFGNNTDDAGRTWLIEGLFAYPYFREVIERIVDANGYTIDASGFLDKAGNADIVDEVLWFNPSILPLEDSALFRQAQATTINSTQANPFSGGSTFDNFQNNFTFVGTIQTPAGPADIVPLTGIWTAPYEGVFTHSIKFDCDLTMELLNDLPQVNDRTVITTFDIAIYLEDTTTLVKTSVSAFKYSQSVFVSGTAGAKYETPFTAEYFLDLKSYALGSQYKIGFSVDNVVSKYVQFDVSNDIKFWLEPVAPSPPVTTWTVSAAGDLSNNVGNHLQKDVLSLFLKQFNILMTSDDERKIVYFDQYDDFFQYDLIEPIDLDPYIDTDSLSLTPEGLREQVGAIDIGLKKGSGYFADLYNDRMDKTYGNYYAEYFDLWNKKEEKSTIGLQSIPVIDFTYIVGTEFYTYPVASLAKDNTPNNKSTADAKAAVTRSGLPSLMYYKTQVIAKQPANPSGTAYALRIRESSVNNDLLDTGGLTFFLWAGHLRIKPHSITAGLWPFTVDADLNMGLTTEVYFRRFTDQYTNNNLFNRFFVNRLWSKLSNSSTMAEVTISLNPILLEEMTDYSKPYHGYGRVYTFAGRAWWLIELKDYFVNTTKTATAKFISWHPLYTVATQTEADFPSTIGGQFEDGFLKLLTGNTIDLDSFPRKNS